MGRKLKKLILNIYDLKGVPLLAAGVISLFFLEQRYALRKRKAPVLKRLKTNSVIAFTAGVGMRLFLIPAVTRAAAFGQEKKVGILANIPAPAAVKTVLGLLLLDYGSYTWHRLNHRLPVLWRFHQVHHADLDLDLSTGLRFHLGEVLISVLYRSAWGLLSGVAPRLILIYEILFEAATNFHHTNLKLSEKVDTGLAQLIVTPRMHGIHHSVVREETDSNFSVVFPLWDRLHKTFKLNIPQDKINIGIPYVRRHLGVKASLQMPLQEIPQWRFPDGEVPKRTM